MEQCAPPPETYVSGLKGLVVYIYGVAIVNNNLTFFSLSDLH